MEQTYLAKNSLGEILSFFYKDALCFRERNTVSRLLDNAAEDFDLLIDENDVIHIICQDVSGNIQYVCNEGEQWKSRTLLQSKTPTAYSKHFTLYKVSGVLGLFYVLPHESKWMLVHHLLGAKPEVVDYIEGGDYGFCLYRNQTPFVLYRPHGSKAVCCRVFDWSKKAWGERRETGIEVAAQLRILAVGDDFHALFSHRSRLYYQKFETYDGQTLRPTGNRILIVDDAKAKDTALLDAGEQIYLLWNGASGPCAASSSDGGKTISPPQKLPYARYTALYRLRACNANGVAIRRDTYGYLLRDRLNLLANDRFLVPDASLREIRAVSPTHSVERLAGLPPQPVPAESSDTQRLEIECNKIKIRLTQTEKKLLELESALRAVANRARAAEHAGASPQTQAIPQTGEKSGAAEHSGTSQLPAGSNEPDESVVQNSLHASQIPDEPQSDAGANHLPAPNDQSVPTTPPPGDHKQN